MAAYSGFLCLVFAYTLADNCVERPDGLIIGRIFTLLLMAASALSRSLRSVELRIPHGYFTDVESWRIGPELRGKKVHLVPVKDASAGGAAQEEGGDRPALQRPGPLPVPPREPARQPQRVLGARSR